MKKNALRIGINASLAVIKKGKGLRRYNYRTVYLIVDPVFLSARIEPKKPKDPYFLYEYAVRL